MKLLSTFVMLCALTLNIAAVQASVIEGAADIRNLKQLPNQVYTGGQPDKAELEALAKSGVKTIINFRGQGEFSDFDEAAVVEQLGMNYVHIPIDSKDALSQENVARFHAALNEHQDGVFLHCGSGNRVGAMFALDAFWNNDKSKEEAIVIGLESGMTSLRGHVESLLDVQ
ncbi:protein tyrosine phosphatase family protein [Planctobacterium marinum]|uniref:DSP-PTPase phosphatase fused to NAD+ Kinase domain-containing protein n=1 Tax=Planctobacterium marinum TaxID=1631968 RepID=A0AA48HZI5_9ALTE|nr:hypothetical protein MACH26_30160 [Planctobacterium marinum]